MSSRLVVFLSGAMLYAAGCAAPAWAADGPGKSASKTRLERRNQPPPSPITDHFAMRGVYFQPTLTTAGRFDSDVGTPGTPFSGETDLALDDVANQGRMELLFRMRDRHRLRVDYLKLDRFGDTRLTRAIDFRNRRYNLADRVESNLDLRLMGFTYSWSVLRRESFEIGLGLGLHLVEAEARAEVRSRSIRETGSGTGALPTLGVDGTWRFARRWSVSGRFQYLSVGLSDVKGSFTDLHADVQYRWKPNVAFGLGYSGIKLDADVKSSSLPGTLVIDAKGPEGFFRVSF